MTRIDQRQARWVWYVFLASLTFSQPNRLRAEDPSAKPLRAVAPAEVGMDAAQLAEIAKKMQEFVDAKQASGVVTLVLRRGGIVHQEAVGLADLANNQPMKKDTLFAIASMTKPITATGLMILRDEGKLSLDDPVSKYLPEFKEVKLASGGSPEKPITIRQLLTHTSGLIGDQQNKGSLKETAEMLAQRPLGFEPGTKWQYGPSLSVCGRIIEVVSGQAYDQFLTQRIFQPLGMSDTSFLPVKEKRSRLAKLYQPSADKKSLELATHWLNDLSDDRTPNPSGGLFSTATDLAQFYQMMLNGGELGGKRILSKAAVVEMTRLQTGDLTTGFTPGHGWGLGFCVVREPQGLTAMLTPGTFGHGGAFGTQGWIDPQRQMAFVLLIQRTNFGNSDGSDIRSTFQDLAVKAIRP